MRLKAPLVLLALLILVGASPARAQQVAPSKYWVFFADKDAGAGKTAQPILVDERALARRETRGRSNGYWADIPVPRQYADVVRTIAGEVLVESRWLNAVSVRADGAQISRIAALPFVSRVQPVGSIPPPEEPDAAVPETDFAAKATVLDFGPSRRQLAFVNAIRPLEESVNGAGVRIGFLDTQFDFNHRALQHIVDDGRLLGVRDFTGPNQERFGAGQSNYHGLNVTSIALGYDPGNLIGPAYGAEVLAATTEFAPTETNQEEDNFVAGLEWLESEGVDVVNVSLGYTTFDAGERSYVRTEMDGDTGITTIAADVAASLGVVMVVSAGNEGAAEWRIIGTPADGDSVIAVGAASIDSTRASFSSVGPTADGRIKPDVSAMGVAVVVASPSGGYVSGSGTSFSSPMVAGVVAQILQVNPTLDPMEVLDILRGTADQSDVPDNRLGWGIVDAFAAVEAARLLAAELPDETRIRTIYPNPFKSEVSFEFVSPVAGGSATLTIYDALGRRVDEIFDGAVEGGTSLITYRPMSLPSGVYFYRLETSSGTSTGTIVHVR